MAHHPVVGSAVFQSMHVPDPHIDLRTVASALTIQTETLAIILKRLEAIEAALFAPPQPSPLTDAITGLTAAILRNNDDLKRAIDAMVALPRDVDGRFY